MAKIVDREGNIKLEINLLNTECLNVDLTRHNTENWIPFELRLVVQNEIYQISKDLDATFTLFELYDLIDNLEIIINAKKQRKEINQYLFCTLECYFELILYETYEENEIYIDLWLNLGTITQGNVFGYDKGFRFVVYIDELNKFKEELKDQLERLILK